MVRSMPCLGILAVVMLDVTLASLAPVARCRDCLVYPLESRRGNYFTEPVPCAARVTSMQVLTEASGPRTCIRDISYGFYGANAWVDLGCRGTFRLCFVEGTIRDVTCESVSGRRASCSIGAPACEELESVSIVRARSNMPCVRGFSFEATKNHIEVSKGCRGMFQIGCRACITKRGK